jgi:hypothetical protein
VERRGVLDSCGAHAQVQLREAIRIGHRAAPESGAPVSRRSRPT